MVFSRSSRFPRTRSEFLTPPSPLDSFIREFSLISLLIPSVYRIFVSRANRMNYIPPRSDKHFTSVQLYYFSLHGWLVIFSFFRSISPMKNIYQLSVLRVIPQFTRSISISIHDSRFEYSLIAIWSRLAARIYFVIVTCIRFSDTASCSFSRL